ncbi:pterin-4-alpha-carbinolamine dehydratase [Chthonomonas calidirosea]|uniref:Putative pterin-4-alpha-carbinolamine dehydratase n=1 Tax=Chthonomonas calidirosea (strain DSM 23976 / ICMP 18418 / T49) TaxID=1303518 RepID=S0EU06_CHTCT|nr:4a-hydroxytetrahydrobiopterin dehydratase [Chthonomonas calidirosea]CCW35110.1 pterin-4-alpha-carbinolamine dehydratase [Chthonomonas calidirosea T49]CEK20275.1 pterin-4-alpha-carbinolamine dehydratase [Chthonomonas calidirosea]CEK20276.1 pterin-4-alpha-carbinolamine dehydratase [Chthonomonas calidirosea]CEK20873.1 pterin-4-alpha-carbinolamine dehydratase [Chthonomonas calidirosea]
MARPAKLTEAQIQQALAELPEWRYQDDKLQRTFKFTDFSQAWGFMSRVALMAEKMDHHPDWSNVYNTVNVALSTHDAGGVTELDLQLARHMNRFYAERG